MIEQYWAYILPVRIVCTLCAWKKFLEITKAFNNRIQNPVTIFYHTGPVKRENDWRSRTSILYQDKFLYFQCIRIKLTQRPRNFNLVGLSSESTLWRGFSWQEGNASGSISTLKIYFFLMLYFVTNLGERISFYESRIDLVINS